MLIGIIRVMYYDNFPSFVASYILQRTGVQEIKRMRPDCQDLQVFTLNSRNLCIFFSSVTDLLS